MSGFGRGIAFLVAAQVFLSDGAPIEVRVRQTPTGPRVFVDGKSVPPRFFYGSPACLCNISDTYRQDFVIPFRADADTDRGCLTVDAYPDDDPMWFSNLRLVDVEAGTTNVLMGADDEVRTRHFRKNGIVFREGRLYRFLITHRATHFRTYFTHEVSYEKSDGTRKIVPLPYGDTLCDTARLAAEAGVRFITFSTDTSWGCDDWWRQDGGTNGYAKIEHLCERLIVAHPGVLLVPRVKADAPEWMLAAHPEMRMRFDNGMTIKMSSVSSRFYQQEACRQIERLVRHLRERFPRHFAGIHISGQNSAEWFYMMSQGKDLSGYDESTRDAFRAWLAAHGESDAAYAEVPTGAERRVADGDGLRDPIRDRRVIDFHRFRQEEMARFLADLGRAARRGSDGKSLVLFFYGYTWELGAVRAGAAETGHFGVEWLLEHAKDALDGISAPISYSDRGWPGSASVMSAAETLMREGILWINENDNRTMHEDIWDHMWWPPQKDPWIVRNAFLRDSAVQILRGYGDWWMDLFGRGWFRDGELWKIRRELAPLDEAMSNRHHPYSPEVALCVNEESFLFRGWNSHVTTVPVLDRRAFEKCGATYGQYLLNDFLSRVPSAKLCYLLVADNLTLDQQRRLKRFKAAYPQVVFVERPNPEDLTCEAIARTARKAGVHLYTQPGSACVAAAEGFVMIQSQEEGPLEVDFGAGGEITDFLNGKTVGFGPRLTLPFGRGETRIFRVKTKDVQ